jgi:Flp pilus assembly protein CpaB
MKWSILGLSILGTIAATCAVVLVLALQTSASPPAPEPPAPPRVPMIVAARELDARQVVGAEDVLSKEVDPKDALEGALGDTVRIIGRVLVTPMKAGQPFLDGCFASAGSGLHLASALQPGRRAVSVTLSDTLGMEDLLYPGAIVDVLTTVKVDETTEGDKQISVTILESVLVLAVGTRTIVSPTSEEPAAAGRGRPTVTLLVDPVQAERLKLAMENGSVSLALRNPSDTSPVVSGGARLTSLAPVFEELAQRKRDEYLEQLRAAEAEREQEWEKREYEMERARYAIERAREEIEIARKEYELERHEATKDTAEGTAPEWTTVILKGKTAETKVFKLPEGSAAPSGR